VTSSPVVGPGNCVIYVGGNMVTSFFSVAVDKPSYKRGLPDTPWPKYQRDWRNSGVAGIGR
jgi:hypothetical protein